MRACPMRVCWIVVAEPVGHEFTRPHGSPSRHQVVQIHSFAEQQRLRVTAPSSTRGRHLSVPLDYPAICRVVLDNASGESQNRRVRKIDVSAK